MTNSKNIGIALVAVVIAIGAYFFPTSKTVVERVTETLGAFPGPDVTVPMVFRGGTTYAKNLATSTSGSAVTLNVGDLRDYNTVFYTPNVSAVTVTIPASSTLAGFLPEAGMTTQQCWYNATGTAAATITFAASTGIDWEIATSTNGAVGTAATVAANESACFTFVRGPRTSSAFDIMVLYQPYVNAD